MATKVWLAALLTALLLPASCTPEPAAGPVQRSASETLVVRIDPGALPVDGRYYVSPDARRVAYLVEAGDGWATVADGRRSRAYEWRTVFEQRVASPVVWSADGSRVAYVGRADGKEFAVVDGQEGKPYDEVNTPVFSPDGRHVAYVAAEGSSMVPVGYDWVPNPERKRFAVVDGQESPPYYGDGDGFTFSADLSRLAYVTSGQGWHGLALDGKESEFHVFVSDGPLSDAGHDVVVDRREGKGYSSVKRLFFSPDGRRIAYIAADYSAVDAPFIIGADGRDYGPYSGYCCPNFSPDGRHLAWQATKRLGQENSGSSMVVDGRELRHNTRDANFAFSPDSRRFAYVACEGEQRFVVVDERPGKRYEEVVSHTLTFSPNSRHLAYAAEADGRQFVVLDGREGRPYDGILPGSFAFNLDSRHLACAVEGGGRQFVVVGESEGQRYDEILGGLVVFDAATRFHYLARRGNEILLVEEMIQQASPHRDTGFSPAASPAPSTAEGGERATPCRLVDGGRISGQVLHAGGPATEGTWVSLVFEGGPLQRVHTRDGRYALPLLARECPDGLHWVPFTLWAGGQGQAVRPDRAGYRLDLDAPEPRGRPSDELPECRLALGTLSGEVLSAGARVPDGTPVQARIGPGADSLAQTVLTAGGQYLLTTVGYRCGDEPARFLPVGLSVLGKTVTVTPTGGSAVQDIAVP